MTLRAAIAERNQRVKLLGPTEAQIQAAVVDLLTRSATPGVAWAAIPNGEHRHPAVGAKLKSQGVRAGWPDLVIVIGGKFHGLELKTGRGVVSRAQSVAHGDLLLAGAVVEVAHGVDDAIEVLKRWGAIRTPKFGKEAQCQNSVS